MTTPSGQFDVVASNLFTVYVSTGTDAQTQKPVWTKVEGLRTITPKPQEKTADATTVDNAGWTNDRKVSGGMEYDIAGLSMRDTGDNSKAPGQAALETLALANGHANVGTFAIHDPDTSHCLQFDARVSNFVGFGGDPNSLAPFSATLGLVKAPTVDTATNVGLPV